MNTHTAGLRAKTNFFLPLLIAGIVITLLSGCERSAKGDDSSEKRIADLEKQVQMLQDQNRDLRIKARVVSVFGTNSPVQDFLASPDFWHCTYDSSWSDCSSRCSKQTSEGYAACIRNYPEGRDRQMCVNDNMERGANCLKNCPVKFSPLGPPDCKDGGGPIL